jgi:hypothetical protein
MTASAPTDASDESVIAFVEHYVSLSKGKRFDAKRALWDPEESQPILRPEEATQAFVGWPALERYWSHSNSVMRDLETRCWGFHVHRLSAQAALVTYTQRWKASLTDAASLLSGPIASTVRVVLALRDRGSGWRIYLCIESHVDGVEYARALLRR